MPLALTFGISDHFRNRKNPGNSRFPRLVCEGGYRDLNPGSPDPQSGALTNYAIPTIMGVTDPEGLYLRYMPFRTSLEGFEPATYGLEGRCSIQLSYRLITDLKRSRAGDGNRTHVFSLEG